MSTPLFSLGFIQVTDHAITALIRLNVNITELLKRHQYGDWGDIEEADKEHNHNMVNRMGLPENIISFYNLKETRFYIATWPDRSMTDVYLDKDIY